MRLSLHNAISPRRGRGEGWSLLMRTDKALSSGRRRRSMRSEQWQGFVHRRPITAGDRGASGAKRWWRRIIGDLRVSRTNWRPLARQMRRIISPRDRQTTRSCEVLYNASVVWPPRWPARPHCESRSAKHVVRSTRVKARMMCMDCDQCVLYELFCYPVIM